MTTLKVGIADPEEMKARTMRIARGEEKPAPSDPTVWFASTESFARSEEHTSELQSLMRISYAVFCLKKKNRHSKTRHHVTITHQHIHHQHTIEGVSIQT